MNGYFVTDYIELKKIMVEKKFNTITDLATESRINRNTLSNVLNGKKQPTSDVMEKLVFTLEIEPDRAGRIFFGQYLRDT